MFTTKLNELKNQHAVYRLMDCGTMEVLFIGYCQLTRLFQLTDASRNPQFNHNVEYLCEVLEIHPDRVQAHNSTSALLRKNGPLPKFNRPDPRGRGTIVCDQTAETFTSVQEAARVHGIDPGALSKHLNRHAGFKSVKKRTYFYLTM
jgi:hypothetical protein